MTARILLVEDDRGLRLTLTHRLAAEGYEVQTAADGDEGLRKASSGAYDLVLLDVMLPGRSGFEVCRELRRTGSEVPVLMLTARGQVDDKVTGLKLGADDYLTKPFEMAELLARVEARLRRSRPGDAREAQYRFGDVVVDVRGTEVTRAGVKVEMSAKEFRLLLYFVEHPGETLSREELLGRVWGYDSTPTTRTVDMHVAWLRRKLEPNSAEPQFIHTVRGLGYKFTG
jgi:two-component system alkaline phosphatase synthesis response regulator PhoP